MKKNVFLIISILFVILSAGTLGYLYYQNSELEKETQELKDNISKVEQTIENDKKELSEKEDEYEKLKEKVKESLEELSLWEDIKDELNKSLS